MNSLMFVNGLDRIVIGCIVPDSAQYGKYQCNYAIGGNLHQYAYHQKCGFKTFAEGICWFLERFPAGDVLDPLSFLQMQHKLLTLKLPNPEANVFDPLYMVERKKPTPVKKTKDGQIISDFE
jgi:hypothetical protein